MFISKRKQFFKKGRITRAQVMKKTGRSPDLIIFRAKTSKAFTGKLF
jgi:hypothetical protein